LSSFVHVQWKGLTLVLLRAMVWWGNDEPVKGFPTHLKVKSVGF
jgi:hypothetical protein